MTRESEWLKEESELGFSRHNPGLAAVSGREKPSLDSSARVIGTCLAETLKSDPHFYLFSPDETTSNRLDAVYEVSARAWAMPKYAWDLPESKSGRIIELLSENVLFATMLGHIMSGEQAMMTSYESFFTIITSQILQHLKFLQQSESVIWRDAIPAVNLLSTSTCWRQDHNGFTHQSPALISTLLARPGYFVNCFFPADAVSARATYDYMLKSQNVVNLTTFNKTEEPVWLDSDQATYQLENGGASIFDFISDDNPDFVFAAAGDIATRETIAAIKLLRRDLPDHRYRLVNIAALTHNAIGTTTSLLSPDAFEHYFTSDKPIIANFHGYSDVLTHILAQYTDLARITIHGFNERGTTTTPFEMLSLNHATRYHLAIDVARRLFHPDLVNHYEMKLLDNSIRAKKHGEDEETNL